MAGFDRQVWANRLYIALIVGSFVAVVALIVIVRFGLLAQFDSGLGAGISLASACLLVGSPFLRGAYRWLRPIFGTVAWDARAALNSGLSMEDFEKSITTEKMLRTRKFVDRFGWGVAAFMVAVAALETWTDVDRDGSAAWAGLLMGFGATVAMLVTEALLLLAVSWIRRWALGAELVGRAVRSP